MNKANNKLRGFKLPELLLFGLHSLSVHQECVAFLKNADHCLSGVQLDFISVIVKVTGGAVIRSFFPGNMNAFPISKKPAVAGIVVALKRKITFLVPDFIIGILNQQVFKRELFVISQINVRAVALSRYILVSVIKSCLLII